MTLFRFHRGGLAESMETVVEVRDLVDLKYKIQSREYPMMPLDLTCLEVKAYPDALSNFDARINWHTHIVHLPGFGVFGFTNGPIE